jgi:hypothetical protein
MTYKYTTIRIQRKEALLGYIVPKGALFIRGNGLQFVCTERPKDLFDIPVMMFQNGSWHKISVSVMYSYLAREIVNFI